MEKETVLVTGASAGIGWELARLFAAESANLILVARRVDRLENLAQEIRQKYPGASVRVLASDLSRPESPDKIYDVLQRDGVTVDVLVNNAGFGGRGRFLDMDLQRQADMVQVNVTSPTRLARLFLPGMVGRNSGGIINVASTAAFQPGPYMGVYYATKAYLLSLSEALTEELKRTRVTVTCLAPGPTDTEFAEAANMETTLVFRHMAATAESVARAGHQGFRRGKALVIPGVLNRMAAFSVRTLPRSAVRRVIARIQGGP